MNALLSPQPTRPPDGVTAIPNNESCSRAGDFASRLLEDFEADLRVSSRIDLETWRRSRLEKTREKFWSYFGEVF